jgi:hypothetical protein
MFLTASIAEMLMSGMELALSVVAARCIRKRDVSSMRWLGVGIVSFGLLIVGATDVFFSSSSSQQKEQASTHLNDNNNTTTYIGGAMGICIGILLIIGQTCFSVLQDISEEIVMQEGGMPAAQLLGVEGCFGVVLGTPLYLVLAGFLDQDPLEPFQALSASRDEDDSTITFVVFSLGLECRTCYILCQWRRKSWRGVEHSRIVHWPGWFWYRVHWCRCLLPKQRKRLIRSTSSMKGLKRRQQCRLLFPRNLHHNHHHHHHYSRHRLGLFILPATRSPCAELVD